VGSSTGNSEASMLANIELLFEKVDKNGEFLIFNQFTSFTSTKVQILTLLLFEKVDENGDFSIDKEEFTRHLKPGKYSL
jgi:hypothetical protein